MDGCQVPIISGRHIPVLHIFLGPLRSASKIGHQGCQICWKPMVIGWFGPERMLSSRVSRIHKGPLRKSMAQPHRTQERRDWHLLTAGVGITGECQRCGNLGTALERRCIGGLDVKRSLRAGSSVNKTLGLILSTEGKKKISK